MGEAGCENEKSGRCMGQIPDSLHIMSHDIRDAHEEVGLAHVVLQKGNVLELQCRLVEAQVEPVPHISKSQEIKHESRERWPIGDMQH